MIYTSYFAKLNQIQCGGITPISISRGVPNWFNGIQYTKLAPSWDLLNQYKKDNDWDTYTRRYYDEVLSKLNFEEVLNEIESYVIGDKALLCWESYGKNCHRHLVAEWFIQNGVYIRELYF